MSEGPTCLEVAKALGEWANCAVPDCPNKCCLSIGSVLCFPHSFGLALDDPRIKAVADAVFGLEKEP